MEISVTGVNHSAPIALREQVALPESQAVKLLRLLRRAPGVQEALVLSTCNRTEVYLVTRSRPPSLARLLALIAKVKGASSASPKDAFYRRVGLDAVSHLFRVSASLDSQVVGEHEILGQVKEAYRLALEGRTSRFLMNKLMHRAFRTGRRVQTETGISLGAASVAGAAVELAQEKLGSFEGKTVLLVGAGQTAELAGRNLARAGARKFIVANRTLARGRQLADTLRRPPQGKSPATCPVLALAGAPEFAPERSRPKRPFTPPQVEVVALKSLPRVLASADFILSSTGAPHAILTRDMLQDAPRAASRPLLIVDLAVPRDVDPKVEGLPRVQLRNIDDLNQVVARNVERRRLEIPRAEAIVREEAESFRQWHESLKAVPTIKRLRERTDELLAEILREHRRKYKSSDHRQLETLARQLCSRMLHHPISFLHRASKSGPSADLAAIEMIQQMFGLDGPEEKT
jgi:glutamyl-tRNA reductase